MHVIPVKRLVILTLAALALSASGCGKEEPPAAPLRSTEAVPEEPLPPRAAPEGAPEGEARRWYEREVGKNPIAAPVDYQYFAVVTARRRARSAPPR